MMNWKPRIDAVGLVDLLHLLPGALHELFLVLLDHGGAERRPARACADRD